MADMFDAMTISAYGMRAQGERTRIISENIANASTGRISPESEPYARKVITFKNEMDRELGHKTVNVEDITEDRRGEFPLKFMPDHPGADADGYVAMPNVNVMKEMADMISAQRAYEANITAINTSKSMAMKALEIGR